ncbi:MAG: hypothetical protein KDA80_08390 [Planctomycetaceae bacterium]|nr:hypothetical protein [Planctomycetaceae bacterium]
MRVGNFHSASGAIQDAFEELKVAWEATREYWDDANADAFEENYLKLFSEELAQVIPAIGQISQSFGMAQRELEE